MAKTTYIFFLNDKKNLNEHETICILINTISYLYTINYMYTIGNQ